MIRHIKIIISFGIFYLHVMIIYAQVITLDSILHVIDKQNPMLQEYDNNIDAVNAYASGAKSWMAPMVGAGTFMTPYPGQRLMEDRDKGSVMISVEQSIPNPVKLTAKRNYLASRAGVEEQARTWQYNTLRADARLAYYQWIVAEARIKLLHEDERIVAMMIDVARIRYAYNQANLSTIYKAESRQQQIQNSILTVQTEIDEKRYTLSSLMNLPPDIPIMIDTSVRVSYHKQLLYDTLSISQRSDVKQMDKTIEMMRLNQQLQKFQAKPDLRIRFDHMQPLGNMPTQFTAMAMVSIPIAPWSSKMYKAEVRGIEFEIDAMQKKREALLVQTKAKLAGMTSRLARLQQQQINYKTKIIPALRKYYETLMLAYQENREQLPAVLDGWETLIAAQMEYLNTTNDFYNLIVTYEKELEQ